MESIIEIEGLKFAYHENSDFQIEIPHWSVESGKSVFLYGPSGSGKTTLLGILTGLIRPQSGSIKILGSNFSELNVFERDRFRALHIGYIFQQLNLISYLSVRENILISHWNAPNRFKSNRFKDAEEEMRFLTDRLEISQKLESTPKKLSVGQQQRVAVARALMGPPEILIADEPTSALDEDRQRSFLQLMLDLARDCKVSVVFVSHNRQLAELFDSQISIDEIIKSGAKNAS